MPMFREKGDRTAEDQAARAMRDWAVGAPPAELAVELMGAFNVPDGKSFDELGLVSWLGFGDYAFRDHPLDFIQSCHFPESMVAASMSVSAADRACSRGEVSLSEVASARAPSKSTASWLPSR
jgi:hypothetical protein